MTASYALTAYGGATRQLRAALVFAAVNLPGSIIFLMSVAGTYPRARGTMWLPPLGNDRQEGP
jgi:multicomponent Na+:H+ antiporter subunit D